MKQTISRLIDEKEATLPKDIVVPVYFMKSDNEIIIDEYVMREEFEQRLSELVALAEK